MKRERILFFAILVLIFCVMFVIYGKTSFLGLSQSDKVIKSEKYIIEDFYNLFELEPTNNRQYKYQILNKNKDIIFEDTTFRLPPDFMFLDEGIIQIRTYAGSNVYFDRFYNILDDGLSEVFNTPYTAIKKMIISVQYVQEKADRYLIV